MSWLPDCSSLSNMGSLMISEIRLLTLAMSIHDVPILERFTFLFALLCLLCGLASIESDFVNFRMG